jgi:hypothetical protein
MIRRRTPTPARPSATKWALSVTVLTMVAGQSVGPAAERALTFEKDVRPILKAHCFHCHGEGEKLKGGLDVRLKRFLVKGGDSGPVIVPGKGADSLLLELVSKGEMPKGEKKLSTAEISTLKRWIEQGAKTARAEPENLDGFHITEEERNFWAFQPVKRPPVPPSRTTHTPRNPIDAFLLEKLRVHKLDFNPEADRITLIRRATFDLTGLPPTPEAVEAFVNDPAPDAYERLIDRLLTSPAYGERWGRHWLDIAGYADSDGYTDADPVRKYAWKYRDYVIRSLNADKPFDQFLREQLAGDEMVRPPYKNLAPGDIDKLVATGFLRMAPDGTGSGGVEQKVARNQVIADTLSIVSSSLMGLTVACAQCHDHRYDPISQEDYYRLRAVFEPAFDPQNWRTPQQRLISLMTEEERARAAEIEQEAAKLDAGRSQKQAEFIAETLEKELARKPEELRDPLRTAYNKPAKDRTKDEVKLLKDHPTVGNLSNGSLYLYNQKMADELAAMAAESAKVRARKPVEDFVHPLTEPEAKQPPVPRVFYRGDIEQPKQAVQPGDLSVLEGLRPISFAGNNEKLPSSGRRLALAHSLTDGTHPLTARVLVNRVWLHHFGRGLVATPGDFGQLGERPSHPGLLDWLASEFVTPSASVDSLQSYKVAKGGGTDAASSSCNHVTNQPCNCSRPAAAWSLKRLHKLIMTSAAYRQSSTRDPKKDLIDPDNRLLGRMNVRRLEAETLRDALLAVSGSLNPAMSGPPVPVMEDEVGQVVVGVDTTDTAGRPTGKFVALNGDEFRRSVYVQVRRTKPLGMLETFDAPAMEPNCSLRNASTVAPQSLAMMNGEFAVEQARRFAERVATEAGAETVDQIKRAWRIAFGMAPSEADIAAATQFLEAQAGLFKTEPPQLPPPPGQKEPRKVAPDRLALATYCQALLASNRFLYVD